MANIARCGSSVLLALALCTLNGCHPASNKTPDTVTAGQSASDKDIALLESGDARDRGIAIKSLLETGVSVAPLLANAIKGGPQVSRCDAMRCIIILKSHAADAQILASLDDADPQVRSIAALATAELKIHGATAKLLKLASTTKDHDEPSYLLYALAETDPAAAIDIFREHLTSRVIPEYGISMDILTRFKDARSLPVIRKFAAGDGHERRFHAMVCLSQWEPEAKLTKNAYLDVAKRFPTYTVRQKLDALAAPSMSKKGLGSEIVMTGLRDEAPEIRLFAANAAGHMRLEQAQGVLARLAADDSVPTLQDAALKALNALNSPLRFPILARLANSPTSSKRSVAVGGIEQIRAPEDEKIARILVRDPETLTSFLALKALIDSGRTITDADCTKALEAIYRQAGSPDVAMRAEAMSFMAYIPTKRAKELMEQGKRDPDDTVRWKCTGYNLMPMSVPFYVH